MGLGRGGGGRIRRRRTVVGLASLVVRRRTGLPPVGGHVGRRRAAGGTAHSRVQLLLIRLRPLPPAAAALVALLCRVPVPRALAFDLPRQPCRPRPLRWAELIRTEVRGVLLLVVAGADAELGLVGVKLVPLTATAAPAARALRRRGGKRCGGAAREERPQASGRAARLFPPPPTADPRCRVPPAPERRRSRRRQPARRWRAAAPACGRPGGRGTPRRRSRTCPRQRESAPRRGPALALPGGGRGDDGAGRGERRRQVPRGGRSLLHAPSTCAMLSGARVTASPTPGVEGWVEPVRSRRAARSTSCPLGRPQRVPMEARGPV